MEQGKYIIVLEEIGFVSKTLLVNAKEVGFDV